MNKRYRSLLEKIEQCQKRLTEKPEQKIPEKAFLALVEATVRLEAEEKKRGVLLAARSV